MQLPLGDDHALLVRAFYNLSDNPSMSVILQWLRTQRDALDKVNRIPGHENKVSAAFALSMILEVNESARTTGLGRQV